jgi:ADP-ribose pyrophosphatase YjhB (NUDIX family)
MVQPVAAGICFITDDGRVLLLKRAGSPHTGTWAYPGGGIEAGETPEQAARREVREECGYDYTGPLLPLGINEQGFQGFAALVPAFTPTLNDEHSESTWAPFDKLPTPLIPGMAVQSAPAPYTDVLMLVYEVVGLLQTVTKRLCK